MKNFVTRVSVGEFVGEGEGKSKKISKKNAARAVLEQLRRLPPLPAVERVKPRIKKKSQPTCKVREPSSDNPQARREAPAANTLGTQWGLQILHGSDSLHTNEPPSGLRRTVQVSNFLWGWASQPVVSIWKGWGFLEPP